MIIIRSTYINRYNAQTSKNSLTFLHITHKTLGGPLEASHQIVSTKPTPQLHGGCPVTPFLGPSGCARNRETPYCKVQSHTVTVTRRAHPLGHCDKNARAHTAAGD